MSASVPQCPEEKAEPTCRAMVSAGVACSDPSMGGKAGLLLAQWQSLLGVQHSLAVSNHLFLVHQNQGF